MSKIHSSHLGIESCLRKARDSVFWPNMTGDVVIESHSAPSALYCSPKVQRNQCKAIRFQTPRSRVAADHFKLRGKDYLVIVDFYTLSAVIEFLKEQFSRHGLPDILVTDNGPQFTSQEFKQFTHNWEFVHVASSSHYQISNGKVEAAVKVAKSV